MRRLGARELGRWVLAAALSALASIACEGKEDKRPTTETTLDLGKLQQDASHVQGKSRAQFVAEADRLALSASESESEQAKKLYKQAAELRYQSFVEYGQKVDALESLALLSNLPLKAGDDACETTLLALQLEVLLGKAPREQYRDLFVLRERLQPSNCRNRVAAALLVLSAYEPPLAELKELRDNLRVQLQDTHDHAHEQPAHTVVLPEVLQASLDKPTKITKVEPFGSERTARVVVHVTHPTRFHVGALAPSGDQGPRLFVDIDRATFDQVEEVESQGLLKRVRFGQNKDGARVVLDLKQVTHHRVFYLPEPFRLVIDLSLDAPNDEANLRRIRRVVLDPGHGGHDPGAVGPNGLQEKDVALDVAHRAAPLLAREVGVSTLLTRDVDVFVPLDERAARANAFHADLFISIHLNSNPDRASRGVMTFVLDASRDATASKVAARENSSTEAAAVELANSLSRIDNVARREASELFASLLQKAAGVSLRQKYDGVLDSGVRRAGFYVLAGAAMPAVLFEGSFISNPIEADRLNQEDYRQRLADSIVNAVRAYREGM